MEAGMIAGPIAFVVIAACLWHLGGVILDW
jgi:hypothetical protein